MKVASLISGGKDSLYATYIALNHGWSIEYLVSLIPKRKDSWMFHSINIELVKDIASSMKLPLLIKETCGEKEKELEDLKDVLKDLDIEGVVNGAIASDYQRERIGMVCDELGLKNFSPIWHKDQEKILRYQINAGFEILIDAVSAEGLEREWLGKILNTTNIDTFIELCERYGINPSGEGGEFETLVLDCPLYHERLIIEDKEVVWKKDHGYCVVKSVRKEKKSVTDVPEPS